MATLYLTVKGAVADALTAAAQHGVTDVAFYREASHQHVLLAAPRTDDNLTAACKWFCEDLGMCPWPAGSLLLYR
jgi:hypothetical protein